MEKKIHHIVLTGGPCAGKTSAIAVIEQELTQKGYIVFIVPETATEIIKSGYAPWLKCTTNLDFQRFIMKKQLQKEGFIYKNQYFELDMYNFLKDKAILEIELTTECTNVDIPDFIKVIKEVTDDNAYRNYSFAKGTLHV